MELLIGLAGATILAVGVIVCIAIVCAAGSAIGGIMGALLDLSLRLFPPKDND
jgi:hypothetical protein